VPRQELAGERPRQTGGGVEEKNGERIDKNRKIRDKSVMARKTTKKRASKKAGKDVDISLRIGPAHVEKLDFVREITGARSYAEAVRFVMNLGIAQLEPRIQQRKMLDRLESQYGAQEVLPFLVELGKQERKEPET
jgi:undecaprenyl pyrophosphate synthase